MLSVTLIRLTSSIDSQQTVRHTERKPCMRPVDKLPFVKPSCNTTNAISTNESLQRHRRAPFPEKTVVASDNLCSFYDPPTRFSSSSTSCELALSDKNCSS
jgi:hypothetical protein